MINLARGIPQAGESYLRDAYHPARRGRPITDEQGHEADVAAEIDRGRTGPDCQPTSRETA